MPETAILNAKACWDDDIQDNPGPDYGFPRKRPLTRASIKAPFGRPYTRETQNTGYTFSLSWLNRSLLCVERVKRFAEQFEDGYFTIIDHDAGGRHYVGRFTGECDIIQQANDTYDIRDLVFEEVPGAPMLKYPGNWDSDAMQLWAFNDFGDQNVCTQANTSGLSSGTWAASTVRGIKCMAGAGNVNDTLGMDYRGYGFRLWMVTGPNYGQVEVSLDGAVIDATVDCYSATPAAASMVFAHGSVPTDMHRVKLRALGTKNSASAATGLSFVRLDVMR